MQSHIWRWATIFLFLNMRNLKYGLVAVIALLLGCSKEEPCDCDYEGDFSGEEYYQHVNDWGGLEGYSTITRSRTNWYAEINRSTGYITTSTYDTTIAIPAADTTFRTFTFSGIAKLITCDSVLVEGPWEKSSRNTDLDTVETTGFSSNYWSIEQKNEQRNRCDTIRFIDSDGVAQLTPFGLLDGELRFNPWLIRQ